MSFKIWFEQQLNRRLKDWVILHGGSDFDKPNQQYLGTGEPGGIRPLGKGLYGYAIFEESEAPIAVKWCKIYAQKYGNSPTLHAFKFQPEIGRIGFVGNWYDPNLFTDEQKNVLDLFRYANSLQPGEERAQAFQNAWAAEKKEKQNKLPETIKIDHLPIGIKEVSVLDLSKLKPIQKWSIKESDEKIISEIITFI